MKLFLKKKSVYSHDNILYSRKYILTIIPSFTYDIASPVLVERSCLKLLKTYSWITNQLVRLMNFSFGQENYAYVFSYLWIKKWLINVQLPNYWMDLVFKFYFYNVEHASSKVVAIGIKSRPWRFFELTSWFISCTLLSLSFSKLPNSIYSIDFGWSIWTRHI